MLRLPVLRLSASLLLMSSALAHADNISSNLQINGYATVGAAWLQKDQGGAYLGNVFGREGISNDPSIEYDSLAGLQFSYKVDEKTDLIMQLVAKGADNFDAEADWAYIAHDINDQLTLRGGRFIVPAYMYSDTVRVGHSYPWARLPAEIYSRLPIEHIQGLDLLYRIPLGDWNLLAQAVYGSERAEAIRTPNLKGVSLTLSNDALTVRVSHLEGKAYVTLEIDPGVDDFIQVDNRKATFSSIGALYDDGVWFAAGEFGAFTFDGWAADWNAGYLSVGHYIGNFMPYILASKSDAIGVRDSVSDIPEPIATAITQITSQEQTSVALGVRYQVSEGVSFKAQVDQIDNFKGTSGHYRFAGDIKEPDTTYLYSLSLNVAF